MTNKQKISLIAAVLFSLTLLGVVYARHMTSKNGFSVRLKSTILGEDRTLLIHLPDDYENSGESYPVLYRFDGTQKLVRKTVSAIRQLSRETGSSPDMIVVAIENTYRDRDMWPTHTRYYPESQALGSSNFLAFIETELIPYIDKQYRTTDERIVCGQSLSAVFTLYAFLSKPSLFQSFIACSGAFPGCEPFFKELSETAFQQAAQFEGKKLFITHGLKDPLDPDGAIHQQMTDFSDLVKNHLGSHTACFYHIYENEGHVPKNSLKDGLLFLFESGTKGRP